LRESFRARQLEENKMADTDKLVEQLSGLSVRLVAARQRRRPKKKALTR
jgi:hypothetical protein